MVNSTWESLLKTKLDQEQTSIQSIIWKEKIIWETSISWEDTESLICLENACSKDTLDSTFHLFLQSKHKETRIHSLSKKGNISWTNSYNKYVRHHICQIHRKCRYLSGHKVNVKILSSFLPRQILMKFLCTTKRISKLRVTIKKKASWRNIQLISMISLESKKSWWVIWKTSSHILHRSYLWKTKNSDITSSLRTFFRNMKNRRIIQRSPLAIKKMSKWNS